LNKNRYGTCSLGLVLFLGLFTSPVFAEVSSLQTNNKTFYNGEQIEFSGTVEEGSTGLVTIVIRDQNNEFVMLTQSPINYDDSFEKSVKIGDRFSENGVYNATGFILNMTKGFTTNFTISLDGSAIIHQDESIDVGIGESITNNDEQIFLKESNQEDSMESHADNNYADFVDTSKDPYHYVERYYSEPMYKSWFDRNYPNQTIENAVGYAGNIEETESSSQENIVNEIIPEAQASSIAESTQKITDNSDISKISLAIAGLGILFGAVYGIKRQVDGNSRQISINKDTLRRKIINQILGSSPKEIIRTRLAKGEITLEEYDKLKAKLN
jgi:hypothetical protein